MPAEGSGPGPPLTRACGLLARHAMLRFTCRGVAQPGSAPALGAGGPRFKSGRPDQFISFVYRHLAALAFWCHLPCGLLPGRRSDFATYSIPMISMYGNQTKTPGGKSASRKLLNWRELSGHFLLVWGKMWGPCALLGGLAHGRTCISADRRDVRCCGPPNCYPSRSMK